MIIRRNSENGESEVRLYIINAQTCNDGDDIDDHNDDDDDDDDVECI